MSARSQRNTADAVESLNLAPALRDCLSPGLIIINQHGQILTCTSEATRFLASPQNKLTHLSQLPLALQEAIRNVLTIKTAATQELTLSRDGGHSRNLHVTVRPLDSCRESPQALVVLSDITGFRQIEQAVTRLDRLATIGTLSASMAHEIKNALVAVKTFVTDLIHRNKDAELASLAAREFRRVDSIVSQMLKFGGPAKPTFSRVSVHRILDHSL